MKQRSASYSSRELIAFKQTKKTATKTPKKSKKTKK